MSELKQKLSHTHCVVEGCKTSIFNKSLDTTFHPCPTTAEMRNKWLFLLKSRCPALDWNKSKICSKHFENRYFDSMRKLRDRAIPTIFPTNSTRFNQELSSKVSEPRTKVDRLLIKLSQSDLIDDIKNTMRLVKVPDNFSDCVSEDLQCVPDTPVEAQLWLLIKKQDHLMTRLMQLVTQNKKHVEVLQKNAEESRVVKKDMEQNVESLKYIVKCLQEKHATLEEQIEILTAVESR